MLPENYREIFELFGEGIIIEKDGQILYANSSAKKIIPPSFLTRGIKFIFPQIREDIISDDFSSDTYIEGRRYLFNSTKIKDGRIFSIVQADEYEVNEPGGQLLSNVIGELRSGLSLLEVSYSEFSSKFDGSSAGLDGAAARFQQSICLMERIVDNIDYMKKLASGTLKKNVSSFDFVKVLSDITYTVNHFFVPHGVEVLFSCDRDYIPFTGDREKIEYLIYNLLSNAIKYTFPGGKIAVRLSEDESGVIIRVSDSGPGLKPEEVRSTFARYSYDRNMSDPKAGAGLGLSIVSGIARLHGGVAILDSGSGGVTVTVRLMSEKMTTLRDEAAVYSPSEFKTIQKAMADVLPSEAYTIKYSD